QGSSAADRGDRAAVAELTGRVNASGAAVPGYAEGIMGHLDTAGGRPQAAPEREPSSRVSLDRAATTPLLAEALAAMTDELRQVGNPSSLHNAGRRARRVVEESREQIAECYGARPSEVVFTSGGTEADNLAVKGLYWARRAADPGSRRILAPAIEHHAVLDSLHWLEDHEDAKITWLPVDATGLVSPEALRAAIEQDPASVALITVMWANNEVGTVQPVNEMAEIARDHQIPFHSDAVQAAGQLPVHLAASGATALTITGHKIGGPVGAGALLLARGADLVPVLHGGGQERDVRSGTLDALIAGILSAVPDAVLNGAAPGPGRLPGNAHFSFPGCEGDALLMLLDAKGIACSTGSACTAGVAQPSHVLLAMGAGEARARGSLRFSLGRSSSQADVDALGAVIGEVVERARRASREMVA